jgi:epoxyqueuosine reductase
VDSKSRIRSLFKAESEKLGFCFCGFTSPAPVEDHQRYMKWLEKDCYSDMTYLARPDAIAKRADPRQLMPEVETVVVLGMPISFQQHNSFQIAGFAHYRDYHEQLRELGTRLVMSVQEQTRRAFSHKIFVDSSPVLERSLAVRAGLGWIGKSSMFVHPDYGSHVLLCEIFISYACHDPIIEQISDHCGSCKRCVDSCPTQCIDPVSRTIDVTRCISYLTIEKKGDFNDQEKRSIGNHFFGCDICMAVCPWNQKHLTRISSLSPFMIPDPLSIRTEEAFNEKLAGSSFERLKFSRWMRNLEAVQHNLNINK